MSNDKKTTDEPQGKQYGLKPIETQMLQVILQQQNAALSNFLSYVATERLATQVTPNTKFDINEDFTAVTITELPEEDKPAEPEAKPEPGVIS